MKNQAMQSPEDMDKHYDLFLTERVVEIEKTKKEVRVHVISKFKSGDTEDTFEKTITGKTVEEAWDNLQEYIFDKLEQDNE